MDYLFKIKSFLNPTAGLKDAAQRNDIEGAVTCIERGALINNCNYATYFGLINYNHSPLVIACLAGHYEMVLLLAINGADIDYKPSERDLACGITNGCERNKFNGFDFYIPLNAAIYSIYLKKSNFAILDFLLLNSNYSHIQSAITTTIKLNLPLVALHIADYLNISKDTTKGIRRQLRALLVDYQTEIIKIFRSISVKLHNNKKYINGAAIVDVTSLVFEFLFPRKLYHKSIYSNNHATLFNSKPKPLKEIKNKNTRSCCF